MFIFKSKKRNAFNCIMAILMFIISANSNAQLKKPTLPDSIFSTYYHQRVSHFKTLPKTTNDIVFVGNSITVV